MNTIMFNALKYVFTNDRRDNMNEYNRDIITRLKFIGTFAPGEKIDIKNLRVESNNIFTPIKRLLQGESRDHTYSFINSTIERSFDIVKSYSTSERVSERLMCKNILEDMIKAIKGLQNIQKTYKDDKLFYCNIETIIENVHSKLSEVKHKDPEIFKLKGIFSDNSLETIFEEEHVEKKEEPEEIKKKEEPINQAKKK
jgi:hypothetical protein